LYWNGSAWTASSNITSASGNDRLVVQYDNSGAGPNGALFLRKNYGATAYTTNDGIGLGLQLDSNSQTLNQIATINAVWKGSPSATEITLNTNTLDNAVGPFTPTATFSVAQAILPGDLAVNGGDISTLPGGIANLYNNNAVDTINIGNSVVTEVNIGNSLNSSRVQIKSPTIVGALATQAVFDTVATTVNAFGAATAVNIGAATGVTTIEHDLTVNGGNINLNGQAVAGTLPFITFEEQSADVNPLYGIRGKSSQNDPWFIGAGSTADDEGYLEIATGDNAGLSNSGGQIYVRQYNGATPLTGVPWYGGNGVVVNELILLDNIGNTTIPNSLTVDSGTLFVDATNNRVGVNDITPAYPLDVTGEIRATSNIRSNDSFYSDGDTIYLNYDKTDVNVNVNFGRVSPSTNAVIRWNSSSDSFEWSADGTTWYDFINANLTAPFYNGQLLSYLNGEWINENRVTTTDSNERNVFEYRPLSPIAGPNTSLFLRKDYSNAAPGTPGVGTYADGAGVSLSFQVDSDTQTPPGGSVGEANTYANITGVYSATVPTVSLRTSIDNGATAFTSVGDFTTAGATLPNDLAVNGGDITTTSATASLFNTNATTINIGNGATTAVRIGSSSGVVNIKSPSLVQNPDVGASTTFNLLNTITTDLNIGGAATTVDIGSTVSGTTTIGYDLVVNNDVSADSYIVDNISTYNTQTTNTSLAGTPVQISGTTRVSQKAIIKIIDNVTGEVHMLEALAFRSGTAGFLTTYAEMYSSVALATFTVTGTGGVTSILANPISSNSTTFTVARISLD